jgi:glycerol-3-phosphate dehydrogenase
VNRDAGLIRLQRETFDVLIIGGGATGLGCAVDAASRGYRTALIESEDFSSATSSRSTKLAHGGVRYLQQGNIALVREALRERALLLRNAPGLVHQLPFIVPSYEWWHLAYYATGLRLYDMLARQNDVPRSHGCKSHDVHRLFPQLRKSGLRGALVFWDAHFDDARLAIALAQTAVDLGAAVANYIRAESLLYENFRVSGVRAMDLERGEAFEIRSRAVINATGIFVDALRAQDHSNAKPLLTFSRGSHIVVSRATLPITDTALLVPRTSDGRVLFAVPWHESTLIGTTDVAQAHAMMEPQPAQGEIEYILRTINRYLNFPLRQSDVRSAFAGLRALVNRGSMRTSRMSREHIIDVTPSGLITIAGGKWTTYRKMAQDGIDVACETGGLTPAACRTFELALRNVPAVPQLAHAIEHEMARTVVDLLARRHRTLFIDAREARARAPAAVELLVRSLGRGEAWANEQLRAFEALAQRYEADTPPQAGAASAEDGGKR